MMPDLNAIGRTNQGGCICDPSKRPAVPAMGCKLHDPAYAQVKSEIEPPSAACCDNCRHWRSGRGPNSNQTLGWGRCAEPHRRPGRYDTHHADSCNYHQFPEATRALTHKLPHQGRDSAASANRTIPPGARSGFVGVVVIDDGAKGGSHAGAYREMGLDKDFSNFSMVPRSAGPKAPLGEIPSGRLWEVIGERAGPQVYVRGPGFTFCIHRDHVAGLGQLLIAAAGTAEARG